MKALLPALAAAALMSFASLSQAADGKEIYNQNCAMCHAAGLANAPKFGNKADWEPRVKSGMDALMQSALKGKNAMPARGGNPKLSDEQVAAAVEFMVGAAK
jgi:cytochrome c5